VNFFSLAEAEVYIFHLPYFYRSLKGRKGALNPAGEPAMALIARASLQSGAYRLARFIWLGARVNSESGDRCDDQEGGAG
jgi:hypothetical protein